jgi:hypothetical protein
MELTTTFCFVVQVPAMSAPAMSVATLGSDAALDLVFFVGGMVFLSIWFRGRMRAKHAMKWPEVTGKIIESDVVGAKGMS